MSEQSCVIIAEAGVNHNGDVNTARDLIKAAKSAGADYVKFQSFIADELATADAPLAGYQMRPSVARSQRAMLASLELSDSDHKLLWHDCEALGIGFLSSAFSVDRLSFLVSLGMKLIKVPSGEITNFPFLRAIGSHRLPIYLSTGMATIGEIEGAIDELVKGGAERSEITILQCHTSYPTFVEDVNLRAMNALSSAFGLDVGYSDHTVGRDVAIAAVSLGAKVVEKHLTLDKQMDGPDHKASLDPTEFAKLVKGIRDVESSLGDGVKRPSQEEKKMRQIARKSIVATTAIKAGEILGPENMILKRPGNGIPASSWFEVLGKVAVKDFVPNELIVL